MLYIKVSPNRIFIVNEYWIFIPLILSIEIVIIIRMKQLKARKQKEEVELNKVKRSKIFHLANNNLIAALQIRAGDDVTYDFEKMEMLIEQIQQSIKALQKAEKIRNENNSVDVNYRYTYGECRVEKGLQYINNPRLRKIIHQLYKNKMRRGIIFITRTALCHLAKRYGLFSFPVFPVPVESFDILIQVMGTQIGVTNTFHFFRKLIESISILWPVIVLSSAGFNWPLIIASIISIAGSIGSMKYFYNHDTNFIETEVVPPNFKFKTIPRRIANQEEIVSVDFSQLPSNRPKLKLQPSECSLPEQQLFNPKCNMNIPSIPEVDLPKINYNEVVNMRDVTLLDDCSFSDEEDVYGTISEKIK